MSILHESPLLEQMLLPDLLVTPALQMHEILVKGRILDTFIADLFSDDVGIPQDTIYSHLQSAKLLDMELETISHPSFQESAKSRWQRRVLVLPDSKDHTLAECFSSLEAAQYWNQNRCARIHLHRNIVKLAAYLLHHGHFDLTIQQRCEVDATMARSRLLVTELLDAICHSIPFNLHRIDSYGRACEAEESQRVFGAAGLVWPLEVVITCEQASDWQRNLARSTLRQIGYKVGVRQALVVLEENE